MREAYDNVPFEARERVSYWSSFEKFVMNQHCKCPLHRDDVDFRAAEIQNLLREYDEVLEKAAQAHIKARETEILNRKVEG